MNLVQCWIEHPVRAIDQVFTYTCESETEPGVRVEVDFNGRPVIGFVESCETTDETAAEAEARLGVTLKPVIRVLDSESLITPELHDLAMYMRDTTVSTAISCFQAMLPGKVKPQSGRTEAVREKWVSVSDAECSLTPKQLEAFLKVREAGEMRYSELRSMYPNIARALVQKGALNVYEKEKEAVSTVSVPVSAKFTLKEEQQKAMDEITGTDDAVYLLHGVTGSGKTEVYLQLAEKALQEGRQVLILVPEISLTPQMITRVSERFGAELAIYHSGLNPQEKYEQYRKVKNGLARIVVGTRSAVFLPFRDIGLIVVDEEHDGSYKQENQPAYHCRDIAIWRGKYHHCKVILGSATPSLESYARGIRNVYHLVEIPHRINEGLPAVTVIPLKECMKKGQSYIVTEPPKEKIADRLAKHEQVILLLNRRGYHSMLRCRSCQEPLRCPHCDLAMSYHHAEKVMKCHTCGTALRIPKACPSCGSTAGFSAFGFGTERLENELHEAFPQARLLRMDADTTSRKNMHQEILGRFGRGEADILVGTQMIAKGLDYPNVTLVGVINGDEGLARTDFRSCEVTFDLLMQAGGRSGRAEHQGEVVYQVYDPDHYAVQAAVRQDYGMFFRYEMQFRHAGMYPPYTYMIALTVSGRKEASVNDLALTLRNMISGDFTVIGVISLLKIRDSFRARLILKGKNLDVMRAAVREALNTVGRGKDIRVDVNPMVLDG